MALENMGDAKTPANLSPLRPASTSNAVHNSTVCHIGLSGVRKHTSFRCDTAIWQAFKQLCSANGLSTCDLLEKLLIGFCVGYDTRVAQPTTIAVVVDAPRLVKRVRRRQLVFEDELTLDSYCAVTNCMNPATIPLRDKAGKVWNFCKKHAAQPLRQGFTNVGNEGPP